VKTFELEPIYINLNKSNDPITDLKHSVHGYLSNLMAPAILGASIEIRKRKIDNGDTSSDEGNWEDVDGKHAVSVLGYSLNTTEAIKSSPTSGNKLSYLSEHISHLIVHDDNIGPYARLKMHRPETLGKESDAPYLYYEIFDGNEIKYNIGGRKISATDIRFKPTFLLHIANHKARITERQITAYLEEFDAALELILETEGETSDFNVSDAHSTWDLELIDVSKLKSDCRVKFKEQGLLLEEASEVLVENWPKYIWRASAFYAGSLKYEFLFDATDLDQGRVLLKPLFYDRDMFSLLKIIDRLIYSHHSKWGDLFGDNCIAAGLHHHFTQLDKKPLTLDYRFGRAKVPSYIKEHEVEGHSARMKLIQGSVYTPYGFRPSSDSLSKLLKKDSGPFLWIIDQAGGLTIGVEEAGSSETAEALNLGHPCLTAGARGRSAGELIWDTANETWAINDKTGRYTPFKGDKKTPGQVQNAFDLIKEVVNCVYPGSRFKEDTHSA